MSDHSELLAELPLVEKMSTQERLKHAKKRRNQQLKRFSQYEKQLDKEHTKKNKKDKSQAKNKKNTNQIQRVTKVHFVSNVMLLEAAARNDVNEVRQLLMRHVSPDATNEDGLTALHQCCIDDCEEMMRLLVEFGANVNSRDSELWTPLHAAATCGHVHLCKYLIDKGAELLSVNADGNMPYDICDDEVTLDYIESEMAKRGVTQELIDETRLSTEKNMLNDLKYLADKGDTLEFVGRNGETPLHIAAANGYEKVTEFLLDHHVTVDPRDDDSWQPIHAAACWGHLPVLELLVKNGANIEAKTRNNETPFEICEDIEMKHRIMELKDEIESNRATQISNSRPNRQSRSSSTRSASVRRTSMREKSQISWKEALEEARLRSSAASDDDEDDTDNNNIDARVASLHNGNVEDSVPTSNIDDVQITFNDTDDVEPPRGGIDNQHNEITVSPDKIVEPTRDITTPVKPAMKRQDSHESSSSNRNGSSHHSKAPAPKPVRETTPPPPPPQEPESWPAETPQANGHASESNDAELDVSFREERTSDHKRPSLTPSVTYANSTPTPGTLADLKKHRAQQQLKYRDTDKLRNSISEDSNLGNSVHPPSERNGHSPGLAESRSNSVTYLPEDRPKHRFTATNTEIIGGDDNKTNCCTIL